MDRKTAFKLGFVLKLASEGIGVTELIKAGEVLENAQAKDWTKLAKNNAAPAAPSRANPLTAIGVTGAGLGYFLPTWAGSMAGTTAGDLMASEYDSVRMAKKRYLIKQLRQLVVEAKQKRDNQLLSQSIKEEPDERKDSASLGKPSTSGY